LAQLVELGEPTQIDLSREPLRACDVDRLLQWLGRGEVEARIEALGVTQVRETALAGVWLVDHRDAEDRRLTLQVEIAHCPEILPTAQEDLTQALAKLQGSLERGLGQDP
jgi:hydrogenase-1 operon protein HyaF